jgi:hypothetical protein
MNVTLTQYGSATQNAPGKEGWEEEQRQDNLQLKTHKDAGVASGKKTRIIQFENASNCSKPFALQEIGTVAELEQAICDRFPDFCSDVIGMRVSGHAPGIVGRKYYTDILPYDVDTIYLRLYLKKHPAIPQK